MSEAAKSIPKFDHTKPSSAVIEQDAKYLEQDGVLFSYAELDRTTGRMVPEPVYMDRRIKRTEELRDLLSRLVVHVAKLEKELVEFQKVYLSNRDKFK
jgi:hypothetical protein